jgi:hypothetical protein
LLAAFTTLFLPGDTLEKAKLHIASSASSTSRMPSIRAAHDEMRIQGVVSAASIDKHLDSDNDDKVQEEEGYPPV